MSVSIVFRWSGKMDDGFERWARAYNVSPVNSPKRACELLSIGHDYFYKLVRAKRLTIKKMGAKSVVTGEEIYALVCELPAADHAA
jgi:excisionase family DNA binding protein